MEKIVEFAVRRRWLVAAVFALISAAGIYAWNQLAIDAYPDISDTTVQVVTQVPGLAAEEIEQQITVPLERALNGIPSLSMMRSKNTFGLSTVILVFEDGTDDYWARQRVLERIGDVDLPYQAVPELNPLTSPTGEIYRYVLKSAGRNLRELTDINKWTVIPRLRQIQGVADVSNYGGITTQYQIELDPDKVAMYGVSLSEIEDAVSSNNANAGGSMLVRGDLGYVVRGVGLVRNLDEMGDIVVKSVSGNPVYLKDLGELKYGNLERKGVLGYLDDESDMKDAVEGIVQMLRFQNPSEVLEKVHAAVDDLNENVLPEDVSIHTVMDRTDLVSATLHTVAHTLVFGMLLVISILIVFLGNPRSALTVALAIPFSLMTAFILMWLTDVPANLLSIGAIDFGILVDASIVMAETVLKEKEAVSGGKLDPHRTVRSISKVVKPIIFSTVIIIIAYMPLFAFQRIERKLFTPMAYTVGYALVGALLCALFLVSGMSYAIYRKPGKVYHNRVVERITEWYRGSTEKLLKRPKSIFLPSGIILAAVAVLALSVGKDFLPDLDEGGIWIQVQAPYGISLDKSAEFADTLRNRLKKFDEVTYVMTQVGRDDEGAEAFTPSHIECCVGLKPYSEWKRGRVKQDLVDEMDDMIRSMPGYKAGFSQPIIDMVMDQIAGSHSDLAVKIYGEDQVEARKIAEKVESVLVGIEGASDVIIDQEPPLPQLIVDVDREKIARYGLNVSDVADLMEVAVGGKAVSEVYVGGKVYDVICRYRDGSRDTPEKIGALSLTDAEGAKIPLSAVADIHTALGASTLTREMNRRHLTVRVNLRGRDLSSFLDEAEKKISSGVEYDHSEYQIKWDGQFENQKRAYRRLGVVIPFVLAVMFLLMFWAFGRLRQAWMMISVLPLALFGGLLALNVRGMSFNISSAVGFIALFGLTIQNGIIMISHINDLRAEGTPLAEAVTDGSAHRLRPVIMTAFVAVLGLLPASLATGIGSDVQRPLATVIVYGLLCSTLITLYVVPSLYYMVEKRAEDSGIDRKNEEDEL